MQSERAKEREWERWQERAIGRERSSGVKVRSLVNIKRAPTTTKIQQLKGS